MWRILSGENLLIILKLKFTFILKMRRSSSSIVNIKPASFIDIKVRDEFNIREGGRLIGKGKILKIE